ncbi:TonB-dependent receptor [candidate division KSB1 bacterium]|nr:TonB-dependent receptor [candidate division KSB1 bacterium]
MRLLLVVTLIVLLFSVAFAGEKFAFLDLNQYGGKKVPTTLLNRISVNFNNIPLESALSSISEKSMVKLNYSRDLIPINKRVTIQMDEVHAMEALLAVLNNTGTTLKITQAGQLAVVPQSAVNQRKASGSGRGKISGSVEDGKTGDVLPGANVFIEGTSLGAATNLEGYFYIPNLLPGTYTVTAKYIGYASQSKTVQIMPGENVKLNFELEYVVVEGDEVTVTAQAEGQMAAINQQISSARIMNVVASDRIQEIPDANAAESVGRLPGVSIQRSGGEADGIVIRGMADGFNTVSIDGVKMPSTSESRGVGLAFISPNMLDGIELTKALTPDMEGDATGGAVNFILKDAPVGLQVQLALKGGYSGLNSEFGMPKGDLSVSNRFFNNRLGVFAQLSAHQDDRSTDYFDANYRHATGYIEDQPGEAKISSFALRNIDRIRNRYGFTLVFDYRLPGGKISIKNFASQLDEIRTIRESRADPQSSLGGVDFLHQRVESKRRNISNSLSGMHSLFGGQFDWTLAHSLTESETPTSWGIEFESNYSAYTGTLDDLMLPPDQIADMFDYDLSRVRWNSDWVNYNADEAREISSEINYEIPFNISKSLSGKFKVGAKFRQHNRESDSEHWLSDVQGAGGYDEQGRLLRDEVFGDRDLDLVNDVYPALSNFLDESVEASDLLEKHGFLMLSNHNDMKKIADFYSVSKDSELPAYMKEYLPHDTNDYENVSRYGAGYLMTQLNIGKKLTFIPGVRFEHVDHEFDTYYINYRSHMHRYKREQGYKKELGSKQSNAKWLPMFHLRYRLTGWSDIRFAATKTLRRPNYLDYSPQLYLNNQGSSISRGNPELKVQTSQNYDLHASFYSNMVGLFTVGGFYKEIDDLIYRVSSTVHWGDSIPNLPSEEFLGYNPDRDFIGWSLSEPINNKPTAYVRGIEFEWQTRFWYLPSPFNGLVLNTNIAFIDSETKYPRYVATGGTPPFYRDKVDSLIYRSNQLIGQADVVGNVSLGYDIGGFSARLSFYYQGNTLARADRVFTIQDNYRDNIKRWDLKIRQKVTPDLELFFDLNNITDHPDVTKYNIVDYLRSQENYGWQGHLGIRYTFQ